jgi:hypothetical protein
MEPAQRRRLAALFADDGAIIGFDGSQARGGQVVGHLRAIFSDHATAYARQGARGALSWPRLRAAARHRRHDPAAPGWPEPGAAPAASWRTGSPG